MSFPLSTKINLAILVPVFVALVVGATSFLGMSQVWRVTREPIPESHAVEKAVEISRLVNDIQRILYEPSLQTKLHSQINQRVDDLGHLSGDLANHLQQSDVALATTLRSNIEDVGRLIKRAAVARQIRTSNAVLFPSTTASLSIASANYAAALEDTQLPSAKFDARAFLLHSTELTRAIATANLRQTRPSWDAARNSLWQLSTILKQHQQIYADKIENFALLKRSVHGPRVDLLVLANQQDWARSTFEAVDVGLHAIETNVSDATDRLAQQVANATKTRLNTITNWVHGILISSALTFVFGFGLALLAPLLVRKLVTKPLRHLACTMRELAAGNTDVKVMARPRCDDIGDMASALQVFKESIIEAERLRVARTKAEAMLKEKSYQLSKSNTALRQVNQSLEVTVARRTQELEHALSQAQRATTYSTHIALHDPLTGLPNRRFLRQMIDEMLSADEGENKGLGILHIDLDHFKEINDTLGHAAGDFVLAHTAKCLRQLTASPAFVARIGGDEFVVVSPVTENIDSLRRTGEHIINRLHQPVIFEGRKLRFGASVGMASAFGKKIDPGQLLINADIALYQAKNNGRGSLECFTPELELTIVNKKRLADEIIEGIDRGEFIPFYQPRIKSHTHEVDGAEALARWNHPVRGLLAPFSFLDIAEDIGAISAIDQSVLEQAMRDRKAWSGICAQLPRISVNVSNKRLCDPELIAKIKDLKIPNNAVSFELLESTFLDDADAALLGKVDALKKLGIEIEIDDFGSGHASILSVIKIKPKRLKIDRQIVAASTKSDTHTRLMAAIVEIGQTLGVEVIAEGVETHAHVDICEKLGCNGLQGYLFAKPMPFAEMTDFLKKHSASSQTPQQRAPMHGIALAGNRSDAAITAPSLFNGLQS
ncbi:MAG: EAL domain-containing protein [Pseudomonadota bacterium]